MKDGRMPGNGKIISAAPSPEMQQRLSNCAYPVTIGATVGLGTTKFENIALHIMAALMTSDRVQDPKHLDAIGEKAVQGAIALMNAQNRAVVQAQRDAAMAATQQEEKAPQ